MAHTFENPDLQDMYEERAAILEFGAGVERHVAEEMAYYAVKSVEMKRKN